MCESCKRFKCKKISVWKNSHILNIIVYLKKLVDLSINHKFRGGLLGIILIVTTASEEVTTAEDCACSGNSLPLQEQILPLLS